MSINKPVLAVKYERPDEDMKALKQKCPRFEKEILVGKDIQIM